MEETGDEGFLVEDKLLAEEDAAVVFFGDFAGDGENLSRGVVRDGGVGLLHHNYGRRHSSHSKLQKTRTSGAHLSIDGVICVAPIGERTAEEEERNSWPFNSQATARIRVWPFRLFLLPVFPSSAFIASAVRVSCIPSRRGKISARGSAPLFAPHRNGE